MYMNRHVVEVVFFLSLFGISITLLFLILQPYIGALFVAAILSIIFFPLYKYFLKQLKGRETASALVTTFTVLTIILIPLFIVGAILFQEALNFANTLGEVSTTTTMALEQDVALEPADQVATTTIEEYIYKVESQLNTIAPDADINLDIRSLAQNTALWITGNLGSFFASVAKGALNLFIVIMAMFFFLRDGMKVRELLIRWSPLRDKYDENILHKLKIAVDSVVKGSLLIAIIQGTLTGIGFVLFGVPSPVLWGFVATLSSLIPSVGTGIVWIPGVLYLIFVQENLLMAIALGLWGVLIVGLIDNLLRPILIERGVKVHPFLILLSIFGGLSLFGLIGFLAGPIVLSFVVALVDVFPEMIHLKDSTSKASSAQELKAPDTSSQKKSKTTHRKRRNQ
jgi:predicted PurR-regulated permease PerM